MWGRRIISVAGKVGAFLLVGLLIYWIFFAIRGYAGYCSVDGRRLELEERIDVAVDDYIINQDFYNDFAMRNFSSVADGPNAKLIPYKSKAEFYQVNADCCRLEHVAPEGHKQGVASRIFGAGSGFVKIKFLVRYVSGDGEQNFFEVDNVYSQVTNCGKANLNFY